jgi:hypothetical protein
MNYSSAGCLFTDGTHVLAGYQPKKTIACISGIGGKREEGDGSFLETALREMLEELLGIYDNANLVELLKTVPYDNIIKGQHYFNVIYSFLGLEKILEFVFIKVGESPFYKVFPRTVRELVFSRICPMEAAAEISHLALLPLVPELVIDPYFLKDLKKVYFSGQGLSTEKTPPS